MADALQDPGATEAGQTYLTNSQYKLPTVEVAKGFEKDKLDQTLSLTGEKDKFIELSGQAPDPLKQHQADVPTASPFKVRPSDIKGLEKTILTELDRQVGEYEAFKKLMVDTEGWIFLVQKPGALIPHNQATPNGYTSLSAGYIPDHYGADYTDPDPARTQQIVDSQNALVRAVGDAYHLVGEMAAILNNAAQRYVQADKSTFEDGTNIDDFAPSRSVIPPS
jgi:hypothetical protein